MAPSCPCGQDHSTSFYYPFVRRFIDMLGETVVTEVDGRSWHVPRLYIAMHGLKARDLPTLAEKYGWQVARDAPAPRPLPSHNTG